MFCKLIEMVSFEMLSIFLLLIDTSFWQNSKSSLLFGEYFAYMQVQLVYMTEILNLLLIIVNSSDHWAYYLSYSTEISQS